MSLGRYILFVCSGVVLCAASAAEVLVHEYSGYVLGTDYEVTPSSRIRILQPSDPALPYDFDCYDTTTGDPAVIQEIVALAGIGNVEVMVRPHEGRPYGASDVWLLQLNQTGVTGTIVELNIGADLGALGAVLALTADSVYVGGALAGNLTCETLADDQKALEVRGAGRIILSWRPSIGVLL